VTFDGGTENIARTNDTTATGLLTVSQPIPGGAILFSYTDGTGSPPVVFSIAATGLALAPGTTVLNLAGLITSGNPKLRA
jgi:hypothetical protein